MQTEFDNCSRKVAQGGERRTTEDGDETLETRPANVGFLDLLVIEKSYEYKLRKYKGRKVPNESMSYEVDDQGKFRNSMTYARDSNTTLQALSGSTRSTGLKQYLKRKQLEKEILKRKVSKDVLERVEEIKYPFDLVEWENDVVYDTDKIGSLGTSDTVTMELVDSILEEDWEKYVVVDENDMKNYKSFLTLYLEDPNLIFEKVDEKKQGKPKKKQKEVFSVDKPLKGKYNISLDKYYGQESRTKNSLGTFGVQHSLPALRLDPMFYKNNHTREELRNFHRPRFMVNGSGIRFKAVEGNRGKGQSIIKKAGELTIKDGGPFSLFEYSEEEPFFLVNPGMVSLLNIYYRKSNVRDEYAPDQSQYTILDPEDPSPFSGFGDVMPGTSIQAITNNLFIAPVFKHSSRDYLCIVESSADGEFLTYRNIDNLYCVGQQFPLEEVYAPHSRKLNIFCKNRLKVAAFRLFNSKVGGSKELRISQLDEMFPYFSEGSKRKWLKEYADCVKKGRDNVWVLRPSSALLGEEDLRKLVTPENICQYESMLAGERKLQDSGYKMVVESDDEENEEEMVPPPWCLSRNFVNACNGRGLLELSGPGDPTGIGEGFSFRKIRLKRGNEVENRKIINEHQLRYKEEIDRIWNKQLASLSSVEEIPFNDSFLARRHKEGRRNTDVASETTVLSEETFLTIRRTYGEGESSYVETERISDPRVIKAYLKARKKKISEERKGVLTCGSCGQVGHMKTNKACPKFASAAKMTKKKIEAEKRKARVYLQEIMLDLLAQFFQIPYSIAFHRPVSIKKFPDYPLIVDNPIDLTTIKTKARHNKYRKFNEFLDDLELMRSNCRKYNGEDHSLTRIADSIVEAGRRRYNEKMEEILETERVLNGFFDE
ncbi:transcription initiation factor TFIID subunit TAF1 [Encephalitozoon intestinalis ATCC 50506]|uniref:Transcription initiation factor TFIID subunit TAF1 n=1 Tax=Encephalitozoon intestinalis (strain ATCC 50506) TaxID=876142 RepID=E0S9L2_ENCIT|nr:transcription initiation factor TFIID subunit TAF1 [Encephalitozoon intestinalis ATCC 50506]ADM12397.1 transcription initiation factor TFIID subunit TAF1 [Encephalitozoon intestinalis ATCC 50506]UTX46229.1 DUF3591 domain-containing protein [Encephalitozoon intestinalis]